MESQEQTSLPAEHCSDQSQAGNSSHFDSSKNKGAYKKSGKNNIVVQKQPEFDKFLAPTIKKIHDHKLFVWFKSRHQGGKVLLRTKFTRSIAEYCSLHGDGKSEYDTLFWKEQFPMIVEIVMSILYYDNQVLDKKRNVKSHESICKNVKEARIIHADLIPYILDCVPHKYQSEALKLVSDVLSTVTVGQDIQDQNTYHHWVEGEFSKSYQKITKEKIDYNVLDDIQDAIEAAILTRGDKIVHKSKFIKSYLERIYLTNAYLFVEVAKFILSYSSLEKHDKEKLLRFAAIAGFLSQFVNDISDFIPEKDALNVNKSSVKLASDALKDIENRLITLPLIIHLAHQKNSATERFLKTKEGLSKNIKQTIAGELIHSNAIYHAIAVTINIYKDSKAGLEELGFATGKVKNTMALAENNQIYAYFYNTYPEARKAYKKEKRELTEQRSSSKYGQSNLLQFFNFILYPISWVKNLVYN